MFPCQACLQRHLRALTDVLLSESFPVGSNLAKRTTRRHFASGGAYRAQHAEAFQDRARPPPISWKPDKEGLNGEKVVTWRDSPNYKSLSARKEAALKNQDTPPEPQEPAWRPPKQKSMRLVEHNLNTELKYLQDPLKLADHIRYVLDQNDGDKAVALVRMASKKIANTVSWNHLIDWQMKQGKTKAAIETYNEMKKRGQNPDSYTYLLLLRGLGEHAHHPHTLGRALSLYHSMNTDKGNQNRNIIHVNAVLKVCSRAGDMESMWDIASQLPETGSHAADNRTYTTILNAMHTHALVNSPTDDGAEALARRREATIVDARRLWGPIIKRWRQGDLLLDEDLVCAMGRLLLLGARPRDWDDVLSLIQQTMNIQRLVPRLGTAARPESFVPRIRAPNTPADMKNDASDIVDEYGDARPGQEFDPIDLETAPRAIGVGRASRAQAKGTGAGGFAMPGTNTLSLVLEACLKMAARQPAQNYWHLLTDPMSYGVRPDTNNIHMWLRMLRQSRAAEDATKLVCEEMPLLKLRPTTKSFRIAMSACSRDSNNENAVNLAVRLLDMMQQTIGQPDPRTLNVFVEVLKDVQDMQKLREGVLMLEPHVTNVRSVLTFGKEGEYNDPDKSAAVEVIKGTIGFYDKLLWSANQELAKTGTVMLTDKEKDRMLQRKTSLAAFITRLVNKNIEWQEKEKERIEEAKASRLEDEMRRQEEQAARKEELVTKAKEGLLTVAQRTAILRTEAEAEQKALFPQRISEKRWVRGSSDPESDEKPLFRSRSPAVLRDQARADSERMAPPSPFGADAPSEENGMLQSRPTRQPTRGKPETYQRGRTRPFQARDLGNNRRNSSAPKPRSRESGRPQFGADNTPSEPKHETSEQHSIDNVERDTDTFARSRPTKITFPRRRPNDGQRSSSKTLSFGRQQESSGGRSTIERRNTFTRNATNPSSSLSSRSSRRTDDDDDGEDSTSFTAKPRGMRLRQARSYPS